VATIKRWSSGIKWLHLENLSTTTRIQLEDPDLGNPSIKSNEIVCQAPSGTGKGESNLGHLFLLGLAC
jgi:hypothetical protein